MYYQLEWYRATLNRECYHIESITTLSDNFIISWMDRFLFCYHYIFVCSDWMFFCIPFYMTLLDLHLHINVNIKLCC